MEQLRTIDMILFSIMAVVSGVLSDVYMGELATGFYYSLRTAVCLILMIRWGKYGVVAIFVSSISSFMLSGFELVPGLLYYIMADLFFAIPVLVYGKRNRDNLVSTCGNTIGYVLMCHSTLALGKGLAIFLVEGETTGVIDFFIANFLILTMDCVVLLVLRTLKELIIDIENFMMREGTADGEMLG